MFCTAAPLACTGASLELGSCQSPCPPPRVAAWHLPPHLDGRIPSHDMRQCCCCCCWAVQATAAACTANPTRVLLLSSSSPLPLLAQWPRVFPVSRTCGNPVLRYVPPDEQKKFSSAADTFNAYAQSGGPAGMSGLSLSVSSSKSNSGQKTKVDFFSSRPPCSPTATTCTGNCMPDNCMPSTPMLEHRAWPASRANNGSVCLGFFFLGLFPSHIRAARSLTPLALSCAACPLPFWEDRTKSKTKRKRQRPNGKSSRQRRASSRMTKMMLLIGTATHSNPGVFVACPVGVS